MTNYRSKTFHYHVDLCVAQVWIEDGATAENISEQLKEYLEERLNEYAYEGEYQATIRVLRR